MSETLWTDEQINAAVNDILVSGNYAAGVYALAQRIRKALTDEHEAELARLRAENDDHLDTIGKLADQIGAANEELLRLRSENERLRQAIWDLESAWFDYCQNVRHDVPEREIYDLLAINDGRLTMAEIEAQRDAPPQVQEQ